MSATRGTSRVFERAGRLADALPGRPREKRAAAEGPSEALNVLIMYQDPLMREWAMHLWRRVAGAIGRQEFLVKSWRLGDLSHPLVLPEATTAAAEADMILVAVREWFEAPLEVSAWVEGWVTRRARKAGSLAALIGVPAQEVAAVSSAHRFFETVAKRAGLDFMPRQRPLPPERIDLLEGSNISQRANATTRVLSEILEDGHQTTRLRRRPS